MGSTEARPIEGVRHRGGRRVGSAPKGTSRYPGFPFAFAADAPALGQQLPLPPLALLSTKETMLPAAALNAAQPHAVCQVPPLLASLKS